MNAREDAIVSYDEGKRPAVLERRLPGKVLLLTTPLDERTPEWNDYSRSITTFRLALTYMCARYLCSDAEQQKLNFEFAAEKFPVIRKSGKPYVRYALTVGESSEDISFDDKGVWRGDRLGKAGNYTLWGMNPEQAKEIAFRFSVNTPGEESDLTRVPKEEIEALLGKDSVVPQDRTTAISKTMNWNEPLELFPWLMIALLFLLAIENLLANRFYKPDPV